MSIRALLRIEFLIHAENGGLHDDDVRALHAGQMPVPVLRPASHGRGPGSPSPSASASAAAPTRPGEDARPGPHAAGAAPRRPQGAAAESLCPGKDGNYTLTKEGSIYTMFRFQKLNLTN